MNRKHINKIIKALFPVSSLMIGSPRRAGEMENYLQLHPQAGSIQSFGTFDSKEKATIPAYFKPKDNFLTPFYFIAALKEARVWGRYGAVIGMNDYFITEVSREFRDGTSVDHSVYYTLKQKKCKNLAGNIAIIGTAGANVYYHWMLDILPRLVLVSKKVPLINIQYFITEFTSLPFQVETLEKVGIATNKIIPSNENWNFHVKAQTLYVPSLAGPLGQPTPFQINYLQNLYNDNISSDKPFRRLYISRKKTGRREIVNEDEILHYLLELDFEIIECEALTVAQQVKVFSESVIVISSHGSAFTNLVFCKAGTVVVDIFNETHINPCFWIIANIIGLHYCYITGKSIPIDSNPKNDNTLLNIHILQQALEKILLHKDQKKV